MPTKAGISRQGAGMGGFGGGICADSPASIPAKAGISAGMDAFADYRGSASRKEIPAFAGMEWGAGMERGVWGFVGVGGGCSTPQNRQRRFYPPPQAAGGENKRRGAKKKPPERGLLGGYGGLDIQGDAETDGHSFGRDAENFGHVRNGDGCAGGGVVVYRLAGHQDFRPQLVGFHFQVVG